MCQDVVREKEKEREIKHAASVFFSDYRFDNCVYRLYRSSNGTKRIKKSQSLNLAFSHFFTFVDRQSCERIYLAVVAAFFGCFLFLFPFNIISMQLILSFCFCCIRFACILHSSEHFTSTDASHWARGCYLHRSWHPKIIVKHYNLPSLFNCIASSHANTIKCNAFGCNNHQLRLTWMLLSCEQKGCVSASTFALIILQHVNAFGLPLSKN